VVRGRELNGRGGHAFEKNRTPAYGRTLANKPQGLGKKPEEGVSPMGVKERTFAEKGYRKRRKRKRIEEVQG